MKKVIIIILLLLAFGWGWHEFYPKDSEGDTKQASVTDTETITHTDGERIVEMKNDTTKDIPTKSNDKNDDDSKDRESEVDTSNNDKDKNANKPENVNVEFSGDGDLELVYVGFSNDEHSFEWQLNADESVEGVEWYLVRDEQTNPEYNDRNYWYRTKGSYMKNSIETLDAGTYYFRVCESRDGECVRYSNNVEVVVE